MIDFPPKYKFVSGIDKMKHNIEDAKEKSTTRLKYHLKLCEIISESGENSVVTVSTVLYYRLDYILRSV